VVTFFKLVFVKIFFLNIALKNENHSFFSHYYIDIFSLNSPCIFIILDIHQQNAQINKGAN
jgi:hypothetical protein